MSRAALLSLWCGLTALVLIPARVWAQGGQNGSIIGNVFDQTGAPIKGVKITATSPTQIGGAKSAYSNDEGFFRIPLLQPGKFEVKASAPKMQAQIMKDIDVGITAPTEVTVMMEVATATEEITVVEKPPIVSTTKANIKETFDLDLVTDLPHDGRDNIHEQMVNNIGGAMNGRVRGGAQNQTKFTQDGFEIRGQYPTLKSSAAYEVQSGGYGADAPTASGGAINLVTKSGSNRFEYEFNATADSSYLQFFKDGTDSKAKSFKYVINPTIAGPIIKDRLWFALNMEQHLDRNPREWLDTRLPEPQTNTRFLNKGTLKLTWQMTPRNKLALSSNWDWVEERNRRSDVAEEAQMHRHGRRYFAGLIWESVLTDSLVFRAGLAGGYVPQHIYPASCDSTADCNFIAPISQTYPVKYDLVNGNEHSRNDTYTVEFNTRLEYFLNTKVLGDHQLQLKQQFLGEQETQRISRPGDMIDEFRGANPVQRTIYYSNDPRVDGVKRYGWAITSTTTRRSVVTASDTWRATKYLTLTPALSHIWADGANSAGDTVVASQALAPSITAAWNATRDGRTVIRGGHSIYVDVDTFVLARHTVGGMTSEKCKWDEEKGTYTKDCEFSGGRSRNTFGRPCGPTGYDAQGRRCDEKLKIPRTFEYTFGGEREVVEGIAVSLDAVYRRFTNQYEQNETNRIWANSGSYLEPTGRYRNGRNETVMDLGTPDKATRQYRGVTLGINKREGKFRGQGSYTLSKLTGNVFDGSNNEWGDIPSRNVYLEGAVLPDDHRHEIKFLGTYQWTSWLSTGIRYVYTSGQPYDRLFRNSQLENFTDRRAARGINPGNNINDPGDDRELRRPDIQSFNASIRLNWMPLIGHRLETAVDVLNVLALRTPTTIGQEDGTTFGNVTNRTPPFRIRLVLNFRY
jgi:hypothetical protein